MFRHPAGALSEEILSKRLWGFSSTAIFKQATAYTWLGIGPVASHVSDCLDTKGQKMSTAVGWVAVSNYCAPRVPALFSAAF
jgi:hypothetical protein